ncbi:UDP-Glycosyltransferase/glycogen phosphorylase [Ascodesmis nigricans]|uniref:Sterol 3-beta-glucosyltransferase n=1 Tax=Ascodesmis nigricans TaxID=341454 RepID=A0A4S2N1S4_9PEZI|nr:UDP-Glycosyltransferase/glycogen phosphorylase [Ascodesmis nigricans]
MCDRPRYSSPPGHKFPRPRRRSNDGKRTTQSLYLPSRKPMSDDEDDQEDVCAPKKDVPQNLNQSIFQLFTHGRLPSRLSNVEEDYESSGEDYGSANNNGKRPAVNTQPLDPIDESVQAAASAEQDALSEGSRSEYGPAPFMSQVVEAEALLQSSELGGEVSTENAPGFAALEGGNVKPGDLAKKISEIFGLPDLELVETEYPCWLLQSVLLEGYMYITKGHICFYAYLPKKADRNTKTGYLSKRGKSTLKFTRYWFVLKGDVLSYFSDPKDLYFPSGTIDLRYGISASLVETKPGIEPTAFTIQTDQKHYYFKADSATNASEWVKAVQKAIFRTHNDGDSVKIAIPKSTIIDVEDSPVLNMTDTLKINVLDPETHVIDEYFFSFFEDGAEALARIRNVVKAYQDEKASKARSGSSTPLASRSGELSIVPPPREFVRTTVVGRSPIGSLRPSPRHSLEFSRSSFDVCRRSSDYTRETLKELSEPGRHSLDDRSRRRTQPKNSREVSRDSSISSTSYGESSGMRISSSASPSGSQILSRSDVFRSPTMKSFKRSFSRSRKHGKDSEHSGYDEPPSPNATIRLEPPTRRHTADSSHGGIESSHDSEGMLDNHSDPTLQEIKKKGKFPLQRASLWAGWIGERSKKAVGSLIPTQPMEYLEKVSGMWHGGKKNYRHPSGIGPPEDLEHDSGDDLELAEERFRNYFSLPVTENLVAAYFGHLFRVLPVYGKFYLGTRHICFRSLLPGTKTKMILPLEVVENVAREKGFRLGYSGLVITIKGHEELFFEFAKQEARDDCVVRIFQSLDKASDVTEDDYRGGSVNATAEREHTYLKNVHKRLEHKDFTQHFPENSQITEDQDSFFDDGTGSIICFKPEPMNITCLTIGTRGDVQPFIALCLGLMKDGHKCKIATHPEFKEWVEGYGIEFAAVGGDPAELMRLCVEYGMFTVDFMRYTSAKMRGWLDNLLLSSWEACQGSDLLIEAPSAMAGIHIAEALQIPYFRAFTMPWTRTRSYPHAFAVPERKHGGNFNVFTYVVIDNVFWTATAGQINNWRKKCLRLPRTNLDKMQPQRVPFLYNFSRHVVHPPVDFSEHVQITGYWFLDTSHDWTPPQDLDNFIKQARKDGMKIVYVGFGSVTVNDPAAVTQAVVQAVQNANVRCVLSKGWSDRMASKDAHIPEVPLPDSIFQIKACPHDWLFKQVDAAVHHGGAGTTGASLRAGIPTVIKPFFGDQFFFANRVEDLRVGIALRKLNVASLTKALKMATTDARIVRKAQEIGKAIRKENGVDTAVQAIYRDLEYARTLIKKHHHHSYISAANAVDNNPRNDEMEESWTVVSEDDSLTQSVGNLRLSQDGK